MKTPKKHLWELIRRMIPSEKRYFKTHFGSATNRLTQLFDILNKQKDYDEAAAREELEVAASQFKVLKAQLLDLLLRSLIAGKRQRTVQSKIRHGLEEVDIYLERQLFAEAENRLRQLDQLAGRYGLTLYQYEIQDRLHNISFLELDSTDNLAAEHHQRLGHLTDILRRRQSLNQIRLQLEEWNPFIRERRIIIQGIYEELQRTPAEELDLPGHLAWLQNSGLCYEIMGLTKEAEQCRQLASSLFELNPKLRRELPLSYLRSLKGLTNQTYGPPDLQTINALNTETEQFITHNPQHSPHYIYFLWAQLRAYFLQRRWSEIIDKLEPVCIQHLGKYQLDHYRIAANIFIILANTYLVLEKPQLVQHYIRRFRANRMQVAPELTLTVNLVELVSHWETKDMEVIFRRIQAFKRELNQGGPAASSPLYQLHLDLFQQLAREPYLSDELTSNMLLRIPEHQDDPIFNYYTFLNLERWLQAAAVRQPLAQVIQSR